MKRNTISSLILRIWEEMFPRIDLISASLSTSVNQFKYLRGPLPPKEINKQKQPQESVFVSLTVYGWPVPESGAGFTAEIHFFQERGPGLSHPPVRLYWMRLGPSAVVWRVTDPSSLTQTVLQLLGKEVERERQTETETETDTFWCLAPSLCLQIGMFMVLR